MTVEDSAQIAASPERVYDLLVNPADWFRVDPTLVDATPRERLVLGATGTMRNRRGGVTAKASWTTTELVPNARVTQLLKGFGYRLTEAVVLAADGRGTKMTVTDTLIPTSLAGRLIVALSTGIVERDLRARFARMKALAEAEPAPAG